MNRRATVLVFAVAAACAAPRDNSGASTGHTLASMIGCAASLGWMRSAWNNDSLLAASATPLSRKGTSAARSAFATVANERAKSSP